MKKLIKYIKIFEKAYHWISAILSRKIYIESIIKIRGYNFNGELDSMEILRKVGMKSLAYLIKWVTELGENYLS